jgi:hypothetical protein
MNETWAQWARSKFDTVVLLLILVWLMYAKAAEYHEVLGAILLALTGARALRPAETPVPNSPAPPLPTVNQGQKEASK